MSRLSRTSGANNEENDNTNGLDVANNNMNVELIISMAKDVNFIADRVSSSKDDEPTTDGTTSSKDEELITIRSTSSKDVKPTTDETTSNKDI